MTKTEVDNYSVYAQNKLVTEWNTYLTNLSNGKPLKYPNTSLIFAMIALEVIFQYEPDPDSDNYASNCISEEQFCNVIAYLQKTIR